MYEFLMINDYGMYDLKFINEKWERTLIPFMLMYVLTFLTTYYFQRAAPATRMAASIVDDWQSCRNLQFCNRHMLTNQVACDIDFMVGEDQERIPAHKYILISRSCVFLTMFCGPLAETQREINLPDIEPTVFNALLEWVFQNIFLIFIKKI